MKRWRVFIASVIALGAMAFLLTALGCSSTTISTSVAPPSSATRSSSTALSANTTPSASPSARSSQQAEVRSVVASDCGSEFLPLSYVEGSLNNLPNNGNYQGLASDGERYLYQTIQKSGADTRVFRLSVEGGGLVWMTCAGSATLDVRQGDQTAMRPGGQAASERPDDQTNGQHDGQAPVERQGIQALGVHANGASYASYNGNEYLAMTGADGILMFQIQDIELTNPCVIKVRENGKLKPSPNGIAFNDEAGVMYANFGRDLYELAIPPLDASGIDEGVTVNGVPARTIIVDATSNDLKTTLESIEGAEGIQGIAYNNGRLFEFNQFSAPESAGRTYRYDITNFDSYDVSDWSNLERKSYLVSLANTGEGTDATTANRIVWREMQGTAFANGVQYVANALCLEDSSLWFSITTTGDSDATARDRVAQVEISS